MESTSNLQLIKDLFGYYGQRNIPAFLSMFSEDAVWIEPGDVEDIPYAGSFTGAAGITRLLTILSQSIRINKFVPTLFLTEGKNVTVLGDNDAQVIATGKYYTTKWVYSFTVQQQKVTRLQVFMDTLTIAKAFKP